MCEENVLATANISIDDDKQCWETEDHERHVWGLQVDPRRVFHYLCEGRDEEFQQRKLQLMMEAQEAQMNATFEANKKYLEAQDRHELPRKTAKKRWL